MTLSDMLKLKTLFLYNTEKLKKKINSSFGFQYKS